MELLNGRPRKCGFVERGYPREAIISGRRGYLHGALVKDIGLGEGNGDGCAHRDGAAAAAARGKTRDEKGVKDEKVFRDTLVIGRGNMAHSFAYSIDSKVG